MTSIHTSNAYINFKTYANASKHMNMHISNANNQVHELAPPTCVLLLSKNIDPLQILLLLIHVHDCTLISSPPLSSKDNSYLCSFLSPFVINDHKKGPKPHEICHVKINGYHLKLYLL